MLGPYRSPTPVSPPAPFVLHRRSAAPWFVLLALLGALTAAGLAAWTGPDRIELRCDRAEAQCLVRARQSGKIAEHRVALSTLRGARAVGRSGRGLLIIDEGHAGFESLSDLGDATDVKGLALDLDWFAKHPEQAHLASAYQTSVQGVATVFFAIVMLLVFLVALATAGRITLVVGQGGAITVVRRRWLGRLISEQTLAPNEVFEVAVVEQTGRGARTHVELRLRVGDSIRLPDASSLKAAHRDAELLRAAIARLGPGSPPLT
jgi:hypothetical protein